MTKVWQNKENGHHVSIGRDGAKLNGKPIDTLPKWFDRDAPPDMVFGPLHEWSGGACPVDVNQEVRCIFRGRRPYIGPAAYPHFPKHAQEAMWKHAPAPGRPDPKMDIVAYQVRID